MALFFCRHRLSCSAGTVICINYISASCLKFLHEEIQPTMTWHMLIKHQKSCLVLKIEEFYPVSFVFQGVLKFSPLCSYIWTNKRGREKIYADANQQARMESVNGKIRIFPPVELLCSKIKTIWIFLEVSLMEDIAELDNSLYFIKLVAGYGNTVFGERVKAWLEILDLEKNVD